MKKNIKMQNKHSSNINIPMIKVVLSCLIYLCSFSLYAHAVDESTQQFLLQSSGAQIGPFLYIGADHMLTGYDHLLFLFGVIFFLYKTKDILLYVSLFTLGHSITLLYGVLSNIQVNAYIIDAIIGLSVVYKAFDNLGGFKRYFNITPNNKIAILIFGLFHGLGLATKLQELQLPTDGLLNNLIAFNIGVELGQFFALAIIVIALTFWRSKPSFHRFATTSNTLLMSCGFMLIGYQLTGYFINSV
jgi:hypothetical protein